MKNKILITLCLVMAAVGYVVLGTNQSAVEAAGKKVTFNGTAYIAGHGGHLAVVFPLDLGLRHLRGAVRPYP